MYIKPDPVIPVDELGLVPVSTALREARMQLEDAEWDGMPTTYWRHVVSTLQDAAQRGVGYVNPCF